MVRTIAQLRACSDEELIREHDQKAGNTSVGTAYYVDELNRRENARTIESAHKLARWTLYMATASIAAVVISLVK
ncbi:hypothetical protein GCM10023088_01950 [Actinomadura verrucosospora]